MTSTGRSKLVTAKSSLHFSRNLGNGPKFLRKIEIGTLFELTRIQVVGHKNRLDERTNVNASERAWHDRSIYARFKQNPSVYEKNKQKSDGFV